MLLQLSCSLGFLAHPVNMLAHRRRMAHCQAFGNPLVSYRGPAFHQRGAHHLSGIALSELYSCLLVVQLLHMDKRSNHPTKMQIPSIHHRLGPASQRRQGPCGQHRPAARRGNPPHPRRAVDHHAIFALKCPSKWFFPVPIEQFFDKRPAGR